MHDLIRVQIANSKELHILQLVNERESGRRQKIRDEEAAIYWMLRTEYLKEEMAKKICRDLEEFAKKCKAQLNGKEREYIMRFFLIFLTF